MSIEMNIKFPISNARESENYGLIFEDSNNVTHYFDFDGTYDGYSHDCCIDGDTRTCNN